MNGLIQGWARAILKTIGKIRIEAGGAWYQPPNVKHDLFKDSDKFDKLKITTPGKSETRDESRE